MRDCNSARGPRYANALSNPFVYDDHRIIVENQSLTDLSNVRAICGTK
jgi:hypothetical protein